MGCGVWGVGCGVWGVGLHVLGEGVKGQVAMVDKQMGKKWNMKCKVGLYVGSCRNFK